MKSYTLANWDGGLTNGNTSANTSASTPEAVDIRKGVVRINGGSHTGALKTNGHIPTDDTRYLSGGSRGRREMNHTAKSPLNGVQHANAFTNPSTRFTVNGCATYTKNGTQSNPSFVKFNNKPSLNHSNALSGHREDFLKSGAILARPTSSRTLVIPQPNGHVQKTIATTSQHTLDVRDTASDQTVLAMDVDDSCSSADAEGEEADEDSDDVLLIKDMLLQHEPSSYPPTCPSDSPEDERQLSPLFTPVTSPQNNNRRKPVESPFIAWPPSPVARAEDIAPFPTTILSSPLPPSSPSSLAAALFSLPITTTNPQKPRIDVTKHRRKKRKRVVLSHIEIPPLPLSCPRESYKSSSSSSSSVTPSSTTVLPRSAKQLAHLKVQQTMAETRRIASEIDLDVDPQFDDGRDATYKPPSYMVKKKNAIPGSSRTSVVPCSVSPTPPVAASWQAFSKEPTPPITVETGTTLDHPTPPEDATSLHTKDPSPPITAETGTTLDHPAPVPEDAASVHTKDPSPPNDPEYNVISTQPTPVPTLTSAPVSRHSTPTKPSTQDLSFGLDSSPLSSLPSTQVSPLSLPPLPKAEEKRIYKKRLRHEERESDSDNPKPKKKSKTAHDTRSKDKKHVVSHTTTEEKGRQAMMLPSYCRYNPDRDILRFFLRGIPPTRHSVLAMNTRHVKHCKDLHQDQSYLVDVSVTKRTSAVARAFLAFPPSASAAVGDEDRYYLGGAVQELIETEDEQDEVPTRSKEEEERPPSQAVVQDEPSMIHSVSGPSSPSPQHIGQGQYEAGSISLETEGILHMDQFLADFGPSASYSSHQQQSSSSNNLGPLSSAPHPPHADGYDTDTLSRALVSADRDPFLSGGDNWAPFFPESPTTDSWPKRAEFSRNKHLDEPAIANDTIDPSVLRGDDFEEPPAVQDYRLQEDGIPYSASRPVSPQPVDTHQSQTPYPELLLPSVDDDPFLSPPPDSPLPLSAHRSVMPPRRFLDMVNVKDLDLSSSHSSSESGDDQADEDEDPAYTASSSKLEPETPRRKGPRIVSAKELARIQRQKALEREKEQQRLMATLKASVPQAPATKPKKPGRSFKVRAPPTKTKWECGSDYTTCHHCRARSYRLKMTCKCGKSWCNACILTKYLDQPFDVNLRDWVCPCCQDTCRCDLCTKKRGETYISKRNYGPLSTKDAKDVQVKTRPKRDKNKRNPFLSSEEEGDFGLADEMEEESADELAASAPKTSKRQANLRAEKPFPPTEIVGTPGSHWAAVYTLTGERIATATVGEGNRNVTVSCSIEALLLAAGITRCKKRVFIGRMQPCWGHDMVHKSKVRQLQEGSEDDMVKRLTQEGEEKRKNPRFKKRVYIGNLEMLLELGKRNKKEKDNYSAAHDVLVPDEDLRFSAYSLSPLSSLSSLPDSETESPEGAAAIAEGGKYEPGTNLGANSASFGLHGDIVTDMNGHRQEGDCPDVDPSGVDDHTDDNNGPGKDERGEPGVQLVAEAVQDEQKAVEVVANAWGYAYDLGGATDPNMSSFEHLVETHGDGKDGRSATSAFGLRSLTEKDVGRAIELALSSLRVRENVHT